jgi:hypothetical protein
MPPTLTISEFVGQLKGYSSHEVNQKREPRFSNGKRDTES